MNWVKAEGDQEIDKCIQREMYEKRNLKIWFTYYTSKDIKIFNTLKNFQLQLEFNGFKSKHPECRKFKKNQTKMIEGFQKLEDTDEIDLIELLFLVIKKILYL